MKRVTHLAVPLVALSLLAWPSASPAAASPANKLLTNATVKSVSATSLTVTPGGKDAGKDMTFSVDAKTRVIGKGIGTKAATKGKGGKAVITDLLAAGDRVTVTYDDMAPGMRASRVELVANPAAK